MKSYFVPILAAVAAITEARSRLNDWALDWDATVPQCEESDEPLQCGKYDGCDEGKICDRGFCRNIWRFNFCSAGCDTGE